MAPKQAAATETTSRRSRRVISASVTSPNEIPAAEGRLKRKTAGPCPKYTEETSDSTTYDQPTSNLRKRRRVQKGPLEDSPDLDVSPLKNKVRNETSSQLSDVPADPEPEPSSKKKPTPKSSKSKVIKNDTAISLSKKANKTQNNITTSTDSIKSKKSNNEKPTHAVNGAGSDKETLAKPKRKRKTKEEKKAEAMPIAARTVSPKVLVGAHISAAGGVHNAVNNSVHIGGNAFALFLKSQRKWDNPPIKPEANTQFKQLCTEHDYDMTRHIVPHGSYLVNLAAKDPDKSAQAYNGFLDDIQRAESLGIILYNFHPGNTNGEPRPDAIRRIAGHLNIAHRATSSVVTLLENMAASPAGNTIGSTFEDLKHIIDLVDDKSRIGVCLDTCHAFAAGYDLRSPSAFAETIATFDHVIGLSYLRAVHMNDSKAPFGAHRDLHQNIGTGFLGLRAFHNIVNCPTFAGLPLVLETPIDKKDENGKTVEDKGIWAREIKLLESLVGMDAESDEFRALEKDLADKGAEERGKYQTQFDKKLDKAAKSAASGRGKAARKKRDAEGESRHSSEDDDSE